MKRWAPVVVTLALIAALLAVVDTDRVVHLLRRTAPLLLLLAALATAFNLLVSSVRYQLILSVTTGRRQALRHLVAINLISWFAALFLPVSAASDGVRVALVKQKFGLSIASAIESVVADRLIALVGLCACVVLALPAQALIGVPLSLLVGQLVPAAAVIGICALLVWRTSHGHPARATWAEKIRTAISAVTRHLGKMRTARTQIGLAVLGAVAFAAALWAAARSLGTTVTALEALAFGPAIYLAQVLPFAYFGFGPREAATVFLLAGYASLDAESAFSIGLVLGFCNLIVALPAPLIASGLLRQWRDSDA